MNFFIIGGTEKAGTTALFNFFYGHPQIIPSIKKETNYFRDTTTPDFDRYLGEFSHKKGVVYFEASPGYLAESKTVIHNIKKTISDNNIKLIFILRDPAERLFSSFSFHKSRGYISDSTSLNDYLDAAIAYRDTGHIKDGITEWALKSVFHGEYEEHVKKFMEAFGDNVKFISYDDFKNDPDHIVRDLCGYVGLDESYFDGFEYFSANKTFKPKFKFIHAQLIKINRLLEPFFFRYPKVKSYLLSVYKRINKGKKDNINEKEKARVASLYADSVIELASVFASAGRDVPGWVQRYR